MEMLEMQLRLQQLSGATAATSCRPPPRVAKTLGVATAKLLDRRARQAKAYDQWSGEKAAEAARTPKARQTTYSREPATLQRTAEPEAKLTSAEMEQFRQELLADSTRETRASHKRSILRLMRREYPQSTRQRTDKEVLSQINGDTIERMYAALLYEGKTSASHYVSSWVCDADDEVAGSPALMRMRRRLARQANKFLRHRQAEDLPLERLARREDVCRRKELHPGGPEYPLLAVLLSSLCMFRGKTWRSMDNDQCDVQGHEVSVRIGIRKNEQGGNNEGKGLKYALGCICATSALCPHCWWKCFLQKTGQGQAQKMFATRLGKTMTITGMRQTWRKVGRLLRCEKVTPHSGRVAGARYWTKQGAAEATIAAFGDWRSVENLRRYVATAGLTTRLRRELGMVKTISTMALETKKDMPDDDDAVRLEGKTHAGKLELAMVVTRRKPRKWHTLRVCAGPSSHWMAKCGTRFNPVTMELQLWNEFGVEPNTNVACDLCTR